MEIYVVNVIVKKEKYYLAGFDGTISRNIQDAIVFISKNAAYFNATLIEKMYGNEEILGRVETLTFRELA